LVDVDGSHETTPHRQRKDICYNEFPVSNDLQYIRNTKMWKKLNPNLPNAVIF